MADTRSAIRRPTVITTSDKCGRAAQTAPEMLNFRWNGRSLGDDRFCCQSKDTARLVQPFPVRTEDRDRSRPK